jgi:tripartite ATP-independent transporter DctP family solute receptor
MKKILTFSAALSLMSSTMLAAEPVQLKIGHVLTESSSYQVAADTLKKALEDSGEFEVQIFPRGQLGGEVKMIQLAGVGALDVVVTGSAPVENTAPQFGLLAMPYLFDDLKQVEAVLRGDVGAHFMDYLEPHRLRGLGFISALERNVLTSERKISTPDDMDGLKIRVIQGPAFIETYRALGAQPTPMAYSELYLAMQSGVVDAAEASPDGMIADRFVEVTKYYTLTKAQYMPALMIMSKSKYDALTDEQKSIVDKAAAEASAAGFAAYNDSYLSSIAQMGDFGVTVNEVDTAPFAEKAQLAWPQLMANIPGASDDLKLIEQAKQ